MQVDWLCPIDLIENVARQLPARLNTPLVERFGFHITPQHADYVLVQRDQRTLRLRIQRV